MHIGFPFHVDGGGRSAAEGDQDHIRHLIEQVLFTAPGERVNRPDFGSGLKQLVFGAPNEELLTAATVLIQGSLQQWLSELIEVEGVEVLGQEGSLNITVRYTVRRSQEQRVARFERLVR